jgi:hypothetical protein
MLSRGSVTDRASQTWDGKQIILPSTALGNVADCKASHNGNGPSKKQRKKKEKQRQLRIDGNLSTASSEN